MAQWREDPARPERKKSFRTKDEAQAWLDRIQRDRHQELVTGRKPVEPMLYKDWAKEWQRRRVHVSEGTRLSVVSHMTRRILPVFGDVYLGDITRLMVQDAVAEWSEVLAPRTVTVTAAFLAASLREAVKAGLVRENAAQGVRLPKVVKERVAPLSVEQVQALVDALEGPFKAAAVFAAATGLRPGEWRGLTAERVDLKRRRVHVVEQLEGGNTSSHLVPLKTAYSERWVPVGESTVELLRPLVAKPGPQGLVFWCPDGVPMTKRRVRDAWDAARGRVGFDPGAGWHQLRHHHASLLIAGGASPVAVAHRLGHKDATETLKTYAHLWADDDARLVALSDGLVRVSDGV